MRAITLPPTTEAKILAEAQNDTFFDDVVNHPPSGRRKKFGEMEHDKHNGAVLADILEFMPAAVVRLQAAAQLHKHHKCVQFVFVCTCHCT